MAKCVLAVLAAFLSTSNCFSDWPAYQSNIQRTGVGSEPLPDAPLQPLWSWNSAEPPRPAWAGPAMWDAYANIRDLPAMRDYDSVPHAVVAGNRVCFGSTTDDTVRCLDAATGHMLWRYTTEGPVRIAPMWHDNRVYFGSDDGAAYCLDGETGKLIWRVSAAPEDAASAASPVLNNGRIISRHPIRTGVVVAGGIAYFGAALLPWESGYLCAVAADSGKFSGPGAYRMALDGKTLEGPPAVTQQQLVFPQGRVAPQLFQRADGKDLGALKKSSGGSIVVVNRGQVIHGPGVDSRRGGIAASNVETREQVATFGRGNAMVVDQDTVYMLADGSLSAASLVTRKPLWKVEVEASLALIKCGDRLVLGGVDVIESHDAATGSRRWSRAVPGRAKGLAASGGRLFVSTDEGFVVAFADDVEDPVALPHAPSSDDVETTETIDKELPALRPVQPTPDDPALLGRWVFRRDQTNGRAVANQSNGSSAQLDGAFRWRRSADGTEESIEWDGNGSAIAATDHRKAKLPKNAMTVEAIVRVDAAMTWGGIANVIQDNGAFERGWLLGFRNDKFCFAVCGKEGRKPGTLTYLTDPTSFPMRQWQHVAGVYDGQIMRLYIGGVEAAQSKDQRGDIWYPPLAHFELGAYHDDNEYYRLKGALREVRLYDRALTPEEVRQRHQTAAEIVRRLHDGQAEKKADIFRVSPALRFVDPETAELTWETKTAGPSQLQWWMADAPRRAKFRVAKSSSTSTEHRVRIGPLRSNRQYQYRVVAEQAVDSEAAESGRRAQVSEEFSCDTFFNYSPAYIHRPLSQGDDILASWFRRQAMSHGLCLVYGASLAAEAEQLASRYRVLLVDEDETAIAKLRSEWIERQVYGSCLTAKSIAAVTDADLPGDWANLIVAENTSGEIQKHLESQLKPGGGVMLQVDGHAPTAGQSTAEARLARSPDGRKWRRSVRKPWAGASDWSHLYGNPDNAAYTGESLGNVDSADDLIVQWIGRPGPRYQSDRSGRKPSPLSTAGRLYLQGWRRIVALDSHNGEPLWSLELPRFERFNVPRDCGNWCADDRAVYAAIEDRVWQIDAVSGEVLNQLPLPTTEAETESDGAEYFSWGYSARVGDRLLGTKVRRKAVWTNFWGGAGSGWYDAKSGEVTAHVAADTLFAYDIKPDTADQPQTAWTYDGLVLHATVTADKSRIWFLECRDKETRQGKDRRLQGKAVWDNMYLVCLDLQSGAKRWERKLEADPGDVMASLAHANGRLVLMTSGTNKFHVRAYRDDGKPVESDPAAAVKSSDPFTLWSQHVPWGSDNHGGHMSRPAIVDDTVYVRPFSFSLKSGSLAPQRMPVGGCGTYACTDQALFFRQSTVTVWNRETAKTTTWRRLRPDCWLSTIPSDGMLLSPEGGGGCSCGTWLETSLGFKPRKRGD